jgi:glycosyltransferase involved in cell wall biosynthesis
MANAQSKHQAISVNGRFLSQSITGVQRYALELLSAIDRLLSSRQIEPLPVTVLVSPDAKAAPAWRSLRVQRIGRFRGQLWEQIDLASHARETLLFTPCGGAPIFHACQVITIHDAAIFRTPHAYTAVYGTYYRALQRVLARKAKHLITVSEFSRKELMECLNLPENKISTTWNSGEHVLRFSPDDRILGEHNLRKGSYVLGVGSRNVNKNLDGLIAAMPYLEDIEIVLAIAGGANSKIFGDRDRSGGQIRELGFVSDGELRSLYENAACFAFPSFYEGFGIPPLEALTLGTPVVVSRAASLPEVFGDAALYCDPHSPRDIADKIRSALHGDALGGDVARSYAGRFRWENCARQTWEILVQSMRSNPSQGSDRLA